LKQLTIAWILIAFIATAAGAGDDVKWKRAKDLTYLTPGNETASSVGDPSGITEKYTLSWSTSRGDDIYEITATYVSWEFMYTVLYDSLVGGCLDCEEFATELEKASENFNNNLYFIVTVLADEERHARLSNRVYWDVSLDANGEKIAPTKIEFCESAFEEALLLALYQAGLGPLIIRSKKTYAVEFNNPYKAADPISIKLILLCEDCRRGFEWRFKEE
jgi:hypothetical protein